MKLLMNFILWLWAHLGLIGWPAFGGLTWTASRKFKAFSDNRKQMEDKIDHIMSNHLPHIQQELEDMNSNINTGFDRVADGLSNIRDLLLIQTKNNFNLD